MTSRPPARFILVLDATDGSVARVCNTPPQDERKEEITVSAKSPTAAATTMAPAAPKFLVAGVALHPYLDHHHSDATAPHMAPGWKTLAAEADIARVCSAIATAAPRADNPIVADGAASGTSATTTTNTTTMAAAERICTALHSLLDRVRCASSFDIDVVWVFDAVSSPLPPLPFFPATSPIMVAIFGALSELIHLATNNTTSSSASASTLPAHFPSSSSSSSSSCNTQITFVNASLDTQTPAQTIPLFVSAWADLLGSKRLISHLSACSASTVRAHFFDTGRLWRGTVTGVPHSVDSSSTTTTSTTQSWCPVRKFNVDGFLDLLEYNAPLYPISQNNDGVLPTGITLDGVYLRSKPTVHRWPLELTKKNVCHVTSNASVTLCGLMSLPDATNLLLSNLVFRRHGEIVVGVRPTARGFESVSAIRRWSGHKNSALLLRVRNNIRPAARGREEIRLLVCFPHMTTGEGNKALVEFNAIVMTKIPEQSVPGIVRGLVSPVTQKSTGGGASIALGADGNSANRSTGSERVRRAVMGLPLLSGRAITTRKGRSSSLWQREERSVEAALGVQVATAASVSVGRSKEADKAPQQRRSRRHSRRDSATSSSSSSSSHHGNTLGKNKAIGSQQPPQATPLHDVLSRAAKDRGALLESELSDARPPQPMWNEIEARLLRLHAYVSSVRDVQIRMDVEWIVGVLGDDGNSNDDDFDNRNDVDNPTAIEREKSAHPALTARKRKRKGPASTAPQDGPSEKTGRAEAAMATARKKTRDHQRGFMKSRGLRRKYGGGSSSSSAVRVARSGGDGSGASSSSSSSSSSSCSSVFPTSNLLMDQSSASATPGGLATGGARAFGALPIPQERKYSASLRMKRHQPPASTSASSSSSSSSSPRRTSSKEGLRILKLFDSKTGKMRDRSLSGAPLPRCTVSTGRKTGVNDSAVATARQGFGAQYGGVDHGLDWWHPEKSKAEEKLRRGLRISQTKGGTLSVALKTSGSVAYARVVPEAPFFSPNATIKRKRTGKKTDGEIETMRGDAALSASGSSASDGRSEATLGCSSNSGTSGGRSSSSNESHPSPWSIATGGNHCIPGSQLFVLHETLLQSLVPSYCRPEKFARLVRFAVHMTRVVLEEHHPGLVVDEQVPKAIVRVVAGRNCEHAVLSLLEVPTEFN